MNGDLFTPETLAFAASRTGALQRLQEFVPRAGRYARDRNKVLPGHPNVSRLSPAIRHRLLTENECCAAPRERYAASTIEKFIQEVYWRRYWKAWLSLRPQVWSDYLTELVRMRDDPQFEDARRRAAECESGNSPIQLMNHFAKELVTTGYMHNHARMWFAGWWIHVERLPWQLGADFFFRHLLDADPASNTLSWRWVAGLHTPGKTYLPRRANIEKNVHPEILRGCERGLELLEQPRALRAQNLTRPEITKPVLPEEPGLSRDVTGIWIHEEDLLPEIGPLESVNPTAIMVAGNVERWREYRFPDRKRQWLRDALRDSQGRAGQHFGIRPEIETAHPLSTCLRDWAERHGVRQVAAMRPQIGPLADTIPDLRANLAEAGVQLVLLDRIEDRAVRNFATGGFFTFWKRCQQAELIS